MIHTDLLAVCIICLSECVCVCVCVSGKLKDKYGIWINLIPDGQHALAVD